MNIVNCLHLLYIILYYIIYYFIYSYLLIQARRLLLLLASTSTPVVIILHLHISSYSRYSSGSAVNSKGCCRSIRYYRQSGDIIAIGPSLSRSASLCGSSVSLAGLTNLTGLVFQSSCSAINCRLYVYERQDHLGWRHVPCRIWCVDPINFSPHLQYRPYF